MKKPKPENKKRKTTIKNERKSGEQTGQMGGKRERNWEAGKDEKIRKRKERTKQLLIKN